MASFHAFPKNPKPGLLPAFLSLANPRLIIFQQQTRQSIKPIMVFWVRIQASHLL
jgi:hypothetical protein